MHKGPPRKKYKFKGHHNAGRWQIILDGRVFDPVITRIADGFCVIACNGVQWPGRYVDRHYAARDILRKEGLWDDETENDWMGDPRLKSDCIKVDEPELFQVTESKRKGASSRAKYWK